MVYPLFDILPLFSYIVKDFFIIPFALRSQARERKGVFEFVRSRTETVTSSVPRRALTLLRNVRLQARCALSRGADSSLSHVVTRQNPRRAISLLQRCRYQARGVRHGASTTSPTKEGWCVSTYSLPCRLCRG